jgi:L-histidine Nalpha-methyltransferase
MKTISMNVRPLFETTMHERSFLQALQRRRVPLKFAYSGAAAFTHDRLTRTAGYQSVSVAAQHEIAVYLKAVGARRTSRELVELGPGNGVHSRLLLEEMNRLGTMPSRWLGLDFSATLLVIGEEHVRQHFPRLDVHTGPWDFESSETPLIAEWRQGANLLAVMVGNTLGNVDDPTAALGCVRASLTPGDTLLLGLACAGKLGERELLLPYETAEFVSAALEPLRLAGVDVAAGRFQTRFDSARRAIIGDFVVGREEAVKLTGATVWLKTDERMECFVSRRFEEEDVSRLATSAGWSVLRCESDTHGTHMATVLRAV